MEISELCGATKFRQRISYVRRERPELWPNDWILHM